MKKFNLLPCPFCGSEFTVNLIPALSLGNIDTGLYPVVDIYEVSCSDPSCVLGDWCYTIDPRCSDIETLLNARFL